MRDIITTIAPAAAVETRRVCIYIDERSIVLQGNWQWDLYSNAVFCSDVILSFPQEFNGTKGIIHPDHTEMLKHKLELLKQGETVDIQFNIITTYGEVKILKGEQLQLSAEDQLSFCEPEQLGEEQINKTQKWKQENEKLHADKNTADLAERITHTGTWHYNTATNKTFYSDNVYRIYGLPPQSLNAHLNAFSAFINAEDKVAFIEAFDVGFAKQLPLQLQFRIVSSDMQEKHIEYITQWSFNEKGEKVLNGIIKDTTQNYLLEQKLCSAESETEFQQKLLHFNEHVAHTGCWQTNLLTRKSIYSDNYFKLFGLKPNNVLPAVTTFLNMVHPDDRQLVEEANRKLINEHTVPDIEFRVVRENGKVRHLKQRGKLMVYGDSELVMACTVYDVTTQKMLEEKIAEVSQELNLNNYASGEIENYTGSFYWLWDLEIGETRWSDNVYLQLGYKPNTVVVTQKLLMNFIHPDDRILFGDKVNDFLKLEIETSFSFRLIRRSEVKQYTALLQITEIEGTKYCLGIFKDETEIFAVQEQLKSKIDFADVLTNSMNDRLMVTDINYQLIEWNKRCEESFGLTADEALNQNFFDVFPQLKKEEIFDSFRKVFTGETVKLDHVSLYNNKEKLNIFLAPLNDNNGNTVGIIHILHDVTKEYDLQKDLSERLDFIEKLVESSIDRIVVLDPNMNYVYWNRKCEEYYGVSKEKVIGKNIMEVSPAHNRMMYPEFRKALKGETIHVPVNEEQKDGRFDESFLIPITNEKQEVKAILWILHDLTKEYELGKQQSKADTILNTIDDAFFELDAELNLVYVNRKTEELWGKTKEELLGKQIWQTFPDAVDSPIFFAIQYCLEEKTVVRREFMSNIINKLINTTMVPSTSGVIVFFRVKE